MDKTQAKALLESNGYVAEIENGLLYVHLIVKSQKELNRQAQEIDKILKENGFNRSYGWKARMEE